MGFVVSERNVNLLLIHAQEKEVVTVRAESNV